MPLLQNRRKQTLIKLYVSFFPIFVYGTTANATPKFVREKKIIFSATKRTVYKIKYLKKKKLYLYEVMRVKLKAEPGKRRSNCCWSFFGRFLGFFGGFFPVIATKSFSISSSLSATVNFRFFARFTLAIVSKSSSISFWLSGSSGSAVACFKSSSGRYLGVDLAWRVVHPQPGNEKLWRRWERR